MRKSYNFTFLLISFFCISSLFGQNLSLHFDNEVLNISGATGTYSLDIAIQTDEVTSLGSGALSFDYNSNAFGQNAVSAGNIQLSVPNGYWLAQETNSGQFIYTFPKITDLGNDRFEITWDQVIEGACMDDLPLGQSEALFHLELTYLPNGINYSTGLCFAQMTEDELFTACGSNTICNGDDANCLLFPATEHTNISYSCASVILPCPGNQDEDGDGLCAAEDCDDTDENIGGEGSPCDDGNDCTVNDVYDEFCNCQGVYQDSDDDGVCDGQDECEGFDDSIDLNNNGTPDGCENGADPSCINFWFSPPNKTIECGSIPVFNQPAGNDNCCSTPGLTFTYIDYEYGSGCNKKIERIWIGESACGNMGTIKQTITFVDTEAPTFVIDHDLFGIGNDGDTLTLDCADNLFIVPESVTATDNCDDDVDVNMYDEIEDGHCPTDGYTKFLYCYWVAVDDCGLTDTFDIYVKFIDTTPPEITCPDSIQIQCFESIDPSVTGDVIATDDCTNVTVTYSDITLQSSDCEEVIERTWYAEDECENIDSCKQIITIVDTTPPVVTCPNDLTIDCDDPTDPSNTGTGSADDSCGNSTVTYEDDYQVLSDCEQKIERTWIGTDDCNNVETCVQTINIMDLTPPEITCPDLAIVECSDGASPNLTGWPTATDICDSNLDITFSDDTTFVNGCEYLIDRTWTATDDCGNVATCVQNIKVVDTTPPTIVCPTDVTIECDEPTDPSNTGEATGSDLCDPTVNIWYQDVADIGDCDGSITRTWYAADDCGNTSECVQIITISDFTKPEITCPINVTIQCDDSLDPINTGSASATDNCDQNVTVTFEDEGNPISQCELVISRYWIAEDNCGNTQTCTQIITVTDQTPPEITCPGDFTAECDGSLDPSVTGNATATDDCDSDVQIAYSDETAAIDDCSYQILRTWTATNYCGLTAECVQTILVTDSTPPTIDCPADTTINCDAANDPNATGYPLSFDNCDPALDIMWSDELVPVSDCESYVMRTWTASDNCGNMAECVQKITFIDMTNPTISCPEDATIECDEAPDPILTGEPAGTDNCDMNLTFSFEDEGNPISACELEILRTWTSEDDCGNPADCVQKIIITDTTAPEINCPPDRTIECGDSTEPADTGEPFAFDNCDPDLEISYNDETSQSNDCETVITRTWTATDDCGNIGECVQIITITDSDSPEINCPENTQVECNTNYDPAITGTADGIDNCDPDLNIEFYDEEIPVNDCEFIIERTWTATDNCNNSTSCVQTIKITDTTVPEITCPEDITVECDAGIEPAQTGNPVSTDNCDTDLEVTYSDETTSEDDCTTVITRTWTATDNCGNYTDCQQIITITDTNAPDISCPADATIECNLDDSPFNQGFADPTDNCDTDLDIAWTDEISIPNDCETVISRKWLATDDCGNVSECVQTITKIDSTPPVNTCPPNITVDCNDATDPTVTGEPFAFDNCDADLAISYEDAIENSNGCTIVTKRVWSAEDDCGNVSTCEQFITMTDSDVPTIECPADQTVECDQPTDPTVTGEPTVSDNCDTDLDISYLDNETQVSDCEMIIERVWMVSDDCDNSVSCTQTITITDTTLPEITCPADKTIECDTASDPSQTGEPTASDNCDLDLTITYSDDTLSNDGCTIVLDRLWSAVDNCGNEATCNQTITITDTTSPEITCPDDADIECNLDDSPFTLGFAEAIDNCDADLDISWTDEFANQTNCDLGINRIWTATDDCGNVSECVQTITKIDSTPPVNTCPNDITVDCQDATDPTVTGEPFAFDNCDPDLEITYEDEIVNQDDCQALSQRTWTATDDCGNVSTCVQFITKIDTQAPIISCPADMTLDCDGDYDPIITGEPTFSDDCDTDVEFAYSDEISQNGCDQIVTRTWTATDNCGNTATCDQIITLTDSTASEITCPSDISLECDMLPDPSNTGEATATDNCDTDVTVTYSDVVDNDGCVLTITRTWTATDDCGNSTECVQMISVTDTGLPTINCPPDRTLDCTASTNPADTGEPFAFDGCDPQVDITYEDSISGDGCNQIIERTWTATDDCGNIATCIQTITVTDNEAPTITCPDDIITECDSPVSFDDPIVSDNCDTLLTIEYSDDTTLVNGCEWIFTRTWTATDDCGNVAECIQNLHIIDATNPEITCPADVELSCEMSTDPANTGIPTAIDNCDQDLDIEYSDNTMTSSNCETIIERTWTATDDCGNSVECVQTLKLTDYAAPVLDCPAWVTINCDEDSDPAFTGEATATDDCATPNVTFADSLDQLSICELDIYRTWVATDDCGNTVECVQVVKVLDLDAPEVICPSDVTVECDASTDPQDTGFAIGTDNCDTDVEIAYSDNPVVIDDCTSEIHRTWTATDDCGFAVTCVQIITVTDSQAPQIICPADAVLECNDITDPTMTGMPMAVDNCDQNVTISSTDEIIQVSDCEYIINRTWYATDDCGNEATCVQKITVTDQTAPEITCPADMTVECDGPSDPSVTGEATATDICDSDVEIWYSDNLVTGTGCNNYIERTWTATDDCGNVESCVQIINITDSGIPTINCPPNQTVECNAPTDPTATGEPFAFDNCDPTLDISYSDEDVVIDDCSTEIHRTWKATDDCGNEGTCVQIITITDLTTPSIYCPADTTIECSTEADPSVTGIPTGDDNCAANLYFSFTDDTTTVDDCTLLISRIWTATDDCGNEETCVQKITLTDTTAPELEFNHPLLNNLENCDTIQIECDTLPLFDENSVRATDNCDTSPTIVFMETSEPGDCTIDGIKTTLTYNWIGKDDCGNADSLKITIQVTDTTAPTLTPDHPMFEDAEHGDTLVLDCENFVFLGEDDVIVEDNCGDVTVSFEEEIIQADCLNNGGLQVTMICSWIGTDDCGNSDTLTFTFMVIDTTAPELIGIPNDTSVVCANIPDPANVTAEDGCDGNPTIEFNEYINPPIGNNQHCELVREWTATDECGNSVTETQIITIIDCVGCFGSPNPYFISFTADPDGEQSYLEWEFTNITAPHLFTIQRSADNENFTDIGILEGRINYLTDSDIYNFTDETPRLGNNYYRIKALNLGDVPIYSETMLIRYVEDENARGLRYQLYPNPTTSEVNLEFVVDLDEEVNIVLTNELGIVLRDQILPKETILETIDLTEYPPGIYYLMIETEGIRLKVERVVKMD